MTFENIEKSRTKGQPITLYHFFYVNEQEFFYTDAEKAVAVAALDATFTPIPIQHGRISSSGSLDKAQLEIRMPRTAKLFEGFRVFPPSEVVNVVIRQMHLGDPDDQALVVFTGRVLSAAIEKGETARFSCEPVSTSLRRSGLRRHYQTGCPHALYGPQCLASKLLATTGDITVQSVSGSTIVLTPNWLPAEWSVEKRNADKFVGGLMVWNQATDAGLVETKRTILRVTGGISVQISGPPDGLVTGSTVKMVLGCNHQMSDCQAIHNNIKNFGGQPFIPVKNPFGFTNNYY